jgi:molybdate transport system substrate-binding protein
MTRSFIALTISVAVMLGGCDRKNSDKAPSGKKELLLYCAAGIRPPAGDLIDAFTEEYGIKIVTDYAGSETLLSKIKVARRGDLYMPGDKYYIDQADQAGMILSHRPVCYWIPTILVQKGNPKEVITLEDLLKPGLKVGLGDPNVCAIGKMTRKVLEKNGITSESMAHNLTFQSLTVNELGMQIQAKALDAVIVWDAMARYYVQYGDQIPIPLEKNVISAVEIGVLKFTEDQELAEKFVAFLASQRGRDIFAKHNYRTEPP